MNRNHWVVAGRVLALLTPALSACVSVFPKPDSVELYRFEAQHTVSAQTRSAPPQNVLGSLGTFAPEAAGDRLVAVNAGQVAYVGDMRWAAPAEDLFRTSVAETFRDRQGVTNLLERGDPAAPRYLLRYDVDQFELQYPPTAGAPPTVVVSVHAMLFRASDKVVMAANRFEARDPLPANRASLFVGAYDSALGQVLNDLADWVDANVAADARARASAAPTFARPGAPGDLRSRG